MPRKRRHSRLSGAVKVCAQYFTGKSGKKRCKVWSEGPGYTPSRRSVSTYYIPEVREDAGLNPGQKGRGKYRYRKTLPYLPAEYKGRARAIPGKARAGQIKLRKETVPVEGLGDKLETKDWFLLGLSAILIVGGIALAKASPE